MGGIGSVLGGLYSHLTLLSSCLFNGQDYNIVHVTETATRIFAWQFCIFNIYALLMHEVLSAFNGGKRIADLQEAIAR